MKFHNLHSPAQHKQKRAQQIRVMALVILLAFSFSLLSFHVRAVGVRREVLRLHVIAHSNAEADQFAKYAVRDAILAHSPALFNGSLCMDEAQAAILPRIEELEIIAQNTLAQLGLNHSVHITVDTAFFNTRSYAEAGLTFPAGRYQAVQIFLGDSVGENWWCVMFPPLCLPAASQTVTLDAVLTNGQLRVVQANPRFEVRFRVVELWESLVERLRS